MKLQSLQVARFLAVFLVVFHHAVRFLSAGRNAGLITAVARNGWVGVDLFFVIGVVTARTANGLFWPGVS